MVGLAGTAVTCLGLLFPDRHVVATAWLVGIGFWTAMALGMLMMILIRYTFDAAWPIALRRQFEHGLAAFPWLALMFLPLVAASWLGPRTWSGPG